MLFSVSVIGKYNFHIEQINIFISCQRYLNHNWLRHDISWDEGGNFQISGLNMKGK